MGRPVLFTVITVCYNAEDVLEDTILSVVNQKFDQFEYILIDGNSIDKSLEIINKYKDKIDYYVSEPDLGIYDAMNKGLRLAQGQFINFLNAGDRFVSSNILNEIFNNISIDKTKIISGDFIIINNQGGERREIETKKISFNNLKKDFYACHQSIFINRNIAKYYDLTYQIKADYKWVLEALLSTSDDEVVKLDIPIVFYLKEGFSNEYFIKNLTELIRLHKEYFGYSQVIKNAHIYVYRFLRSVKDLLLKG